MSDAQQTGSGLGAVHDTSTAGTLIATVGVETTTTTTSVPTPVIKFPLASGACTIYSTQSSTQPVASSYSFRGHTQVAQYLKSFSRVELTEVRATIYQTAVYAASSKAYKPHLVRFGLAPRGLYAISDGSLITSTIPNLRNFVTSTQVAAVATVVYTTSPSSGELPFPPGVQTNFRDTEITHNWVEFFIGATANDDNNTPICFAQLDFVVECSGSNFNCP